MADLEIARKAESFTFGFTDRLLEVCFDLPAKRFMLLTIPTIGLLVDKSPEWVAAEIKQRPDYLFPFETIDSAFCPVVEVVICQTNTRKLEQARKEIVMPFQAFALFVYFWAGQSLQSLDGDTIATKIVSQWCDQKEELLKNCVYTARTFSSFALNKSVAKQKPTSKYLYVFVDEPRGVCKIGIASDPKSRLADIQVGYPYPLDLLCKKYVKNARAVELSLHKELKNYRLNGEWFSTDCLPSINHLFVKK